MKERLRQIIDYYNISARSFSLKIGVNESTIRKVLSTNTSIQSNNLAKIAVNFPDINLDWLITGRGNMFYTEPADHKSPSSEGVSPSPDALQAIADERERTIQVLQDTNANLLDEIRQLRAYVNTTSTKYIQMVEQTLEAARQTNGTVQQLQAQIGFHHEDHHHHTIAAHHKDNTH